MMKRTLLVSVCLLAIINGYTQNNLNVKLKFTGLTNDTVSVRIQAPDSSEPEVDTTFIAQNGNVDFSLPMNKAQMLYILAELENNGRAMERTLRYPAVPGETLVLEGSIANMKSSGSKFYCDYQKGITIARAYDNEFKTYAYDMAERKRTKEIDEKEADLLVMKKREEVQTKAGNDIKAFIRNNSDSEAAATMIRYVKQEEIDEAVALLDESVRNGRIRELYLPWVEQAHRNIERLKAQKKIQQGNLAPDFTVEDIYGKSFTLSSLRGKYVILDFWGSWCVWCIKGMPKMKEYYKKYSGKLEIVGVDCRDTESLWKKAVEKHKLPWIHVQSSDDNDLSASYAVSGYPTKIVIDPEGRIAKVVSGETAEFYTYLDSLFKK